MKGKLLTLQEVLNLDDGSKVWIEELNEKYKELSGLHIMDDNALQNHERMEAYDFEALEFYKDELEFYEWIEGVKSINISGIKGTMNGEYYNKSIVDKMSVEIVNLRGLDLTDDNIKLIVEEFS